ncbi:hypothetical protein ADUPG1_006153 [Aduncisulcus paluster]|uniref:Uncharacterized protein n=1 Tax=Aduncisulcus paluster TaxID=2918883 RepID=A0ABQ5KH21_9EUKA|nr:hypothetical protein ADUPG1_006153 [Aduncisulcus paluster]
MLGFDVKKEHFNEYSNFIKDIALPSCYLIKEALDPHEIELDIDEIIESQQILGKMSDTFESVVGKAPSQVAGQIFQTKEHLKGRKTSIKSRQHLIDYVSTFPAPTCRVVSAIQDIQSSLDKFRPLIKSIGSNLQKITVSKTLEQYPELFSKMHQKCGIAAERASLLMKLSESQGDLSIMSDDEFITFVKDVVE